jgi:hypothetical protein
MEQNQIVTRACIGGVLVVLVLVAAFAYYHRHDIVRYFQDQNTKTSTVAITAPIVSTTSLPSSRILEDGYYVSQTFNNCGPSALSMDLSYYGVHVSQEVLADDLRPTHNTTGKGDDKSTTPDEIAAEAEKYGFTTYYRPNGSIQLLKDFIANGIPVITRTLFKPDEDFGHYRVIKGYDDATGQITDEDGFQGPEVKYSYADFMALWQEYNYEYIVLVPSGKEALVQSIIGSDMATSTAWQNAASVARSQISANTSASSTLQATFNLSVVDYYLGNYSGSVAEYEKVQTRLPEHTLWYQMEPIESYYELGNYAKVFSLASSILTNGDPVYPELYILEGQSYEKEGDTTDAKAALEKALFYNKNLQSAKDALLTL